MTVRTGGCLCGEIRYRVTAEPVTARSGNYIQRRFCPLCGSHLFADSSGRPGFSVVRIGTLDDPSSIRPSQNIWTSSAPAWACMDDSIASFDQQPPPPKPAPA